MSIPLYYPKRRYADRLLRSKVGILDDPDWPVLGIPPGVSVVNVAAVAAAAAYTMQVNPLDPDENIPALVSATGVAGDEAATAAAIAAAVVVDINAAPVAGIGQLGAYFDDATSVGDNVYLWTKATAPRSTRTFAGPTALTPSPDDEWPITAVTSNQRDYHTTQPGADTLAVAFVPVDGSGDVLPDDNGMLFTVQIVRYVERIRRSDSDNAIPRTPGVTVSVATTSHPVSREYRVPWYGGRFGIRVSSIATVPTGFVALEMYYREVED